MVKNPPSNARDMSSVPGWGAKFPHAMQQLSLCTTTREAPTTTAREKSAHCNEELATKTQEAKIKKEDLQYKIS